MRRKIFMACTALVVSAAAVLGVEAYNYYSMPALTRANLEALALRDITNPGACCRNGYTKWFGTSNIPTDRKEYFTDCWYNPKEGYDPQPCEC